MDFAKKIDEYSEELFVDLGLVNLPEEEKADIYTCLQEHLHKVILEALSRVLKSKEIRRLHESMEQENYKYLKEVIKKHPGLKPILEDKIEEEYNNLKLTIAKEQNYARKRS